ncbi:MAG: DUF1353 domain-containing protein [Nitrospirales bacterium]|nr:DUF1353 domain-containing protein [Nitrospira sp.]MDR4500886.1 DUF1353 domain-containing protein [Nitrospirales bacterium]
MRTLFLTVLVCIIIGLAAALFIPNYLISRPTITQLVPDPPVFMVAHPLRYTPDDGQHEIVIPVGFVTDLASIPSLLWWWEAPHEGTMAPAIVHDYLYWEQSCTKDEADAVMYLAMLEIGLGEFTANRIYDGIRTPFAQGAWENNRKARTRGETRFFTESYARSLLDSQIEPTVSLVSLQSRAAEHGGLSTPRLPNSKVKAACASALEKFNML